MTNRAEHPDATPEEREHHQNGHQACLDGFFRNQYPKGIHLPHQWAWLRGWDEANALREQWEELHDDVGSAS
jgi:hypothetical protein